MVHSQPFVTCFTLCETTSLFLEVCLKCADLGLTAAICQEGLCSFYQVKFAPIFQPRKSCSAVRQNCRTEPNISLLAIILFLLNFFPCLFRTPWRSAWHSPVSDIFWWKMYFFFPQEMRIWVGNICFQCQFPLEKKQKKPNLDIRHLSFCRENEKRFSIWNHLFRDFQSPQN